MEDILINMGVSALLAILEDKKKLVKWAPAIAKIFVRVENAMQQSPTLAAAIELKRTRG